MKLRGDWEGIGRGVRGDWERTDMRCERGLGEDGYEAGLNLIHEELGFGEALNGLLFHGCSHLELLAPDLDLSTPPSPFSLASALKIRQPHTHMTSSPMLPYPIFEQRPI